MARSSAACANADGRWGATLRIGLSMPIVVERAALSDEALDRSFERDMTAIRKALTAVAGSPAEAGEPVEACC